jgi:hypothetical protein
MFNIYPPDNEDGAYNIYIFISFIYMTVVLQFKTGFYSYPCL